jgi:hypothetical protein
MTLAKQRATVLRATAGVGVTAVAWVLVLAGCGSSGGGGGTSSTKPPSVSSLVHTAKADFRNAKSVRFSGHLSEARHPLSLDLKMLRSGDFSGNVSLSGATFKIVRVSGKTYAYVSKSFFGFLHTTRHIPAGTCALICGKWFSLPPGSFPRISLSSLAAKFDNHVSVPKGTHTSATTFAGQPAYKVASSGKAAFFAKNGHHYLLGFRDQKQNIALNFSQWNSVPSISAPPASKVVHLG